MLSHVVIELQDHQQECKNDTKWYGFFHAIGGMKLFK